LIDGPGPKLASGIGMRPIGHTGLPALGTAGILACAVRNSSPLNRLSLKMDQRNQDRTQHRDPEFPHKLDQPHAGQTVPFRYSAEAPRLSAAFVVQLLGQLMPGTEQPGSDLLAAYGEMPVRRPVCDRLL
jgi:hypothetical protein